LCDGDNLELKQHILIGTGIES